MQRRDLLAQRRDRRADRLERAPTGPALVRGDDVLQVVPGGEQRLQRAVVQILREALALAILGGQGLDDEALTRREQGLDHALAARQERREQRHGGTDPGEVARLDDQERDGVRPIRAARVREALHDVHEHRGDRRAEREARPSPEGRRDRHEDEREADLREAAAAREREQSGERDVERGEGGDDARGTSRSEAPITTSTE